MDSERTPAILPDEGRHAAELLDLGDAFFELDRDWRILRVNRSQERPSRQSREQMLGRVLWGGLAGDGRSRRSVLARRPRREAA